MDDRRAFLKKLAKGAAYATPVISTLAAPARLRAIETSQWMWMGDGEGEGEDLRAGSNPAQSSAPGTSAPWSGSPPGGKPPGSGSKGSND